MVIAVFFFISFILAARFEMRIFLKKVYEKTERIFQILPFGSMAICAGIHELLWGGKFLNSKEPPLAGAPANFAFRNFPLPKILGQLQEKTDLTFLDDNIY